MTVLTILGTRPEIIRLSRIIPLLDRLCRHVVVHTGQNYEPSLSRVFFDELDVRVPDHTLECRADSPMRQLAAILTGCERAIARERPDRVLVLGDTHSALAAIAAKRAGIPVYHMEAGNRCYDDRVPEEVNRRLVDHCSDLLLPYTERSRSNLLKEGIRPERIQVTGNPILEVLECHASAIEASTVLARLRLERGAYFLVTLHRSETVDVPERLGRVIEGLHELRTAHRLPMVFSVHPRTRARLDPWRRGLDEAGILMSDPLGLFDFVHLERHARCVLTDSGTVQEECCLFHVPAVIVRDTTERPETIEAGSGVLSGVDAAAVVASVARVLEMPRNWTPPAEYLLRNVSHRVAEIVLDAEPRSKWRHGDTGKTGGVDLTGERGHG